MHDRYSLFDSHKEMKTTMSENRISLGFLSTAQIQEALRQQSAPRAALGTRLIARLMAGKFDRMLAVGVPAPTDSALAVHAARLTSAAEREAIARTLRRAVRDARDPHPPVSSRAGLERAQHLRRRGSHRRSHAAPALTTAGDRARGRSPAASALRRDRADVPVRPRRPRRPAGRSASGAVERAC